MMSMPFTVLAAISVYFYFQVLKAGSIRNRYSPEIARKLGISQSHRPAI